MESGDSRWTFGTPLPRPVSKSKGHRGADVMTRLDVTEGQKAIPSTEDLKVGSAEPHSGGKGWQKATPRRPS